MSTFTIPNRAGQIRQSNRNDSQGEMIASFGLDLITKPDKIKTAKKLVRSLSEDDFSEDKLADLLLWDGKYYAVTDGELFLNSGDPTTTWANANVTGDSFALNSTMCVFDGQLRITDDTNIASWTGVQGSGFDVDWWTAVLSGTALTTGLPHICAVVQSQKETFFVTDGHWVRYYEKDASSTQNVELAENHVACCLAPALSGSMWVGTYNEATDQAYVYEIYVNQDVGGTPVYNQAYPVDGQAVLAIWVKDNIPYIVTDKGMIQQFNGAGFSTINQFPFSFGDGVFSGVESGLIQSSNRARPIHPRGVAISRDVAFIHLNAGKAGSRFSINSKTWSGIWTFNHTTGQLNHFMPFCNTADELGRQVLESSGALLLTDNEDQLLLAVTELESDTGLFSVSTSSATGWFMTPELTADTVQEGYEAIYHKARTLAPEEAIYTFYRDRTRDTIEMNLVNWVTSDEFITTDDASKLEVGDLVFIASEYGVGNWSIVKNIETSTTTYRITLRDALGLAGENSNIISDNFKLVGFDLETKVYDENNTYTSEDGEYKQLSANSVNGWIQFMVILDGDVLYRQFISAGNAKTQI